MCSDWLLVPRNSFGFLTFGGPHGFTSACLDEESVPAAALITLQWITRVWHHMQSPTTERVEGREGRANETGTFSRSALTAVDQTEMEFMSLGSVSNPPAEERNWVTNLRLGMSARERGKERAAMITRRWG
ncbi:unnamed protein product [Calypogeia fissa]